jgi:phosphatidylglycerophosphatase A
MKRATTDWAELWATFFWVGYRTPAPGTWGSLAALPAAWLVAVVLGPWGFLLATAAVFFSGWYATKLMTDGATDHDPSEIVIDEVAGQGIALFPVVFGAMMTSSNLLALWPGWITAFVLFRLFDIWKPGPIGMADRRGDALGVMLDDVIAGGFAAVGVMLFAILGHAV